MRVEDFKRLKEQIASAKEKKIKLEVQLEQITSDLKKDFGVKSLKEAEELYEKMDKEIEADQEKLQGYLDEIEGMTNWDEL